MNPRPLLRWILGVLDRFNLERERADPAETLAIIERDAEFRGVNLWVLVCAVLVASIGLNVNSTAVIIGAMLISPLMGPIIGIGVSLATYDLRLLRRSGRNFGVAVFFSVLTSALYFTLSPLKEAQSELLARTSPTVWDVLIAFFGGLAGIIAATSREKKFTVIAGVAIATALMPPLCTAGYGIARWDGRFFFGALYLFLINSVFISIAAYLVAQLLRFPNHQESEERLQRRVRRIVIAVVLATLLPSIYLAGKLIQTTLLQERIRAFVRNEFDLPRTTVVTHELVQQEGNPVLRLVLIGEPLDSTAIAERYRRLKQYGLDNLQLEIRQGTTSTVSAEKLRAQLLQEFYKRSEEQLRLLEDSLRSLQRTLLLLRQDEALSAALAEEVAVLYPFVQGIAVRQILLYYHGTAQPDTLTVALVQLERTSPALVQRLEQWLRVRTRQPNLRVVVL